jgi:hypothetical protein
MVHRSHPMSLRTAYYKTWMTQWTAADRETTLSEAYMKVIEALKENMKDEARSNAVEAIHRGDVSKSAGDGFDGYNYMNKQANILTNEAFELCSVVLGELISEESYNTPALYCSFVEQLSEKREDEERWLTQEMRWKLSSLRPTLLMGVNCVSHTLHRWMIMEMGLLLRKQVLINICIHTCMCAAGVIAVQHQAKSDLRNMRREAKGLPYLEAGEESEDDEILNKTDYEEFQERTGVGAPQAMYHLRSTYMVAPGQSEKDMAPLPSARKYKEKAEREAAEKAAKAAAAADDDADDEDDYDGPILEEVEV